MKKESIPNMLTLSRYFCVPLMLGAFYLPPPYGLWLPLFIMIVACLTDYLDGFLARKWNAQTDLGRLLDPNADKLLVAAALIMLSAKGYAHPAAVALILSRELFISALREAMAEKKIVVHVTKLAKWKTTLQMVAAIVLLYAYGCACSGTQMIGEWLLWLATLLTLLSGADYVRKSLKHFA